MRAPVAIAFIPVEKATRTRRMSCRFSVQPSDQLIMHALKIFTFF